jgi:hypothetical protein
MDEPAEHLGRAIGAVAHKPGGVEIEAFHRAFDHALRGQNLCVPKIRFGIDAGIGRRNLAA